MLFFQIVQAPGPDLRKVGKSLIDHHRDYTCFLMHLYLLGSREAVGTGG